MIHADMKTLLQIVICIHAIASATYAAKQPNLLFIFPDQLQRDVLSVYGGPVDTPNIDRLAEEGVLFSDAVCSTPYCAPTRMSLVTGLYPQQHGVVQNTGWKQRGMRPDEQTYPRVLWEDGYATHHYGKWHLEWEKKGDSVDWYPDLFRYFPEYQDNMADKLETYRSRGQGRYSEWYSLVFPVEIADELKVALDHNDLWDKWKDHWAGQMVLGMGMLDLPLEDCFDYQLANLTIEKIQEKVAAGQPFYVNAAFNVPHDPYIVPAEYYAVFPLDEIELPKNFGALEERFLRDWAKEVNVQTRGPNGEEYGVLEFLRVYYANVKFLDDQVGRILEALEETGEMDNTIIVFLADHGDMAGGHGMTWKETVSFYEEVAAIPLIIRYPKQLKPHVTATPANTADVFPTVFDMLGREQLPNISGRSLLPYINGEKSPEEAFPYTFSVRISNTEKASREVTEAMAGHFMVRGKGFKYMVYGQIDRKDHRYNTEPMDLLFDLNRDSGETVNLANNPEYDSIKKEMNQALQDWLEATDWKGKPVLSY
jgi:arylsulfatase A-like enzyme